MKFKIFTLGIASLLFAVTTDAQSRKGDRATQQHEMIKESYKQRKQAIYDQYKRDMEQLGAKSGLSAAERREQRRIVQERFNQQKKDLQAAYKADKKALHGEKKSHDVSRDDRRYDEVKKDKSYKERSKTVRQDAKASRKAMGQSKGKNKGKGRS